MQGVVKVMDQLKRGYVAVSCTRSQKTQSRIDTIQNIHHTKWTRSRMCTILNGYRHEWTRFIWNRHSPELTQTQMGKVFNGHLDLYT